jgi:hypothetical protein
MKRTMLVVVALLVCAFDARAQDSDGDGTPDVADNCLNVTNTQVDPDLDGYGNRCDADFDQDGDTDQDDVDYYSLNCMSDPRPPVCDLDENGLGFDLGEFGILVGIFGTPPGPSGLACAGTVPCADTDQDGSHDTADNCLNTPNTQVDPDLDGYGNICDADFDQDGDTDQDDFDYFSACTIDPACDLDEDGFIGNLGDLGIMTALLGSPPGPSGLACAGTVPCTVPPVVPVPGLGGAGIAGLLLALIASTVAARRRWLMA